MALRRSCKLSPAALSCALALGLLALCAAPALARVTAITSATAKDGATAASGDKSVIKAILAQKVYGNQGGVYGGYNNGNGGWPYNAPRPYKNGVYAPAPYPHGPYYSGSTHGRKLAGASIWIRRWWYNNRWNDVPYHAPAHPAAVPYPQSNWHSPQTRYYGGRR